MRFLPVFLAGVTLSGAVISDVRFKISAGDLTSADAIVDDYRRTNGANTEYADAVTWLARGALVMKNMDAASGYLTKSKGLVATFLKTKSVDDDEFLANAVGGNIEVEARIMVAQGNPDKAVTYLEGELPHWKTFPIQARIQKNLNLLTLEGKPAPELDPKDLGKPILLFLWAHWCDDCRAQAPVIARIKEKYEPRGLLVIAPTRRYGALSNNESATPEQEEAEIERIWKRTYAELGDIRHPISDAIMLRYGVSSTPTLVLIDRKGIVRMYQPYRMSLAELTLRIQPLMEEK